MTHQISRFAAAAAFVATGAGAFAQGPPPPNRPGRLDLVEVVGCLAPGPNNTWTLTNGTEPTVSDLPNTSEAAVKAAAAKPLGTQRYRLLGVSMFSPDGHRGHKMVVKGVFIKDAAGADHRVNVTSFQMAGATCP